jgi:ribonuclease BN (tRNA processing enzyme)
MRPSILSLMAALAGSSLALQDAAFAQAKAPASAMWVTLGTQAGPIAGASRSQPANLLLTPGQTILVDAGDGAAGQLAKVSVPLAAVSAVLLSHLHEDHTGGLAAIIGLRYQLGVQGVLQIYGPPGTRQLVDGIVASLGPLSRIGSGLSNRRRPPMESVSVVEIRDGSKLRIGDVGVSAVVNSHYTFDGGSAGHENELSLSFRFDAPGRSVVYTGDTGPSEAVRALAKGADLLVSEMLDFDAEVETVKATFAGRSEADVVEVVHHLARHHLTPLQVGEMAKAAGVKELVITHLGPGTHDVRRIMMFRADIAKSFDGPVIIANDLDSF